MKRPEPIHKIFAASDAGLGRLLRNASHHQTLQRELERILPPELIGRCRVAGMEKGILCVQTDSPVWANRLRFLATQIVDQLQGGGPFRELHSLKISVCALPDNPPPSRMKRNGDTDSAELLRSASRHQSSPKLQKSLQRLARGIEGNRPKATR